MILNFCQTHRQPDPTFEGRVNNIPVIFGRGRTRGAEAFIMCNGRRTEVLYNLHYEVINGSRVPQVCDMVQNGYRIGYIYPKVVPKKKFLCFSIGYGYYEYMFNNKNFRVYEVGLGDDQHYYCVYHNDVTVAIIHKLDLTIDYLDQYIIYAENPADMEALCSLAIYIDISEYPDYNKHSGHLRENEATLTIDPDLNEMYDPTFIPRIINMG